MVWVGFLFLVAIVVAALVRPLLGRGRPMTGGSDVEVYAAQLAEIRTGARLASLKGEGAKLRSMLTNPVA